MSIARDTARESERTLLTMTWLVAGIASALALIGNVVALSDWRGVYGGETSALVDAALAQDIVTAAVVVPLVAVTARLASRGSVRAHLIGLGALAFLVYNYAIYCFSISFGPLFLLWTAVLGLSIYALVTGLRAAGPADLGSVVRPSRPAVVVLMGVAVLFAVLWFSEIIPDTINGRGSTSASEWAVPTNPVHVLDLGLFLPTAFAVGFRLSKNARDGLLLAPGMLVWFALTGLPIVLTPVVASIRSTDAAWGAVGPIAGIGVVALMALRHVVVPRHEPR
jgi:hypothetical protein